MIGRQTLWQLAVPSPLEVPHVPETTPAEELRPPIRPTPPQQLLGSSGTLTLFAPTPAAVGRTGRCLPIEANVQLETATAPVLLGQPSPSILIRAAVEARRTAVRFSRRAFRVWLPKVVSASPKGAAYGPPIGLI